MLKLKLGYPTFEEGLRILSRFRTEDPIQELAPVATREDIKAARTGYTQVHVDDAILEYVLGIVERTRSHPDIALGASPRASQALLRVVQAYAVIRGRDYVSPDDVKAMAAPVLAHRLLLHHEAGSRDDQAESVLAQIVSQVPVPAEARAAE